MKEQVNHPYHYQGANGIECIDAMIAARGNEAVAGFCELNAFKYLWRAGAKDDRIQDLNKAKWYIAKATELLKDENDETTDSQRGRERPLLRGVHHTRCDA